MWKKTFVETERGEFEVFVSGTGEPLCVTHLYSAFDERGNTFANPFTLHYQVYLINLRDCGNSVKAKDRSQYSMEESIKDLESIRKTLGYEQWGFAGHSTGGMLALKYTVLAPHSLTKIIAGGAAASKEYCTDPDSIYCRKNPMFPRIIEIMNQLNDPSTVPEIRKQLGNEWAEMSFYSREKLLSALRIPNSGKTVGPRLDYFREVEVSTYDLREALVNIAVPSHIYAGRFDAQCPYKYGVEIAELMPNAKLTTFEHSNHNPFVEEEAKFHQLVNSTL
ncbi:alpha/beta fold hydrolase [Sporosarcina sp. SAFN-010]|uniref:alpha/beta fold hydrolase n=1 Tax=Sporosarcina sp. SAFN-010 TaxID=3387273 RepID=UPI003F80FD87